MTAQAMQGPSAWAPALAPMQRRVCMGLHAVTGIPTYPLTTPHAGHGCMALHSPPCGPYAWAMQQPPLSRGCMAHGPSTATTPTKEN